MAAAEAYMIVGFNNGTLISLTTDRSIGNVYRTGNTNSIIQIDSFPNYIMALDSASTLYVFNTSGDGSMIMSQSFQNSVSNVAWRQNSNSTLIVSINFGANVTEYQLLSATLSPTGNVYSLPSVVVTAVKYSGDGNWLVVGTNISQVRFFSTSLGLL